MSHALIVIDVQNDFCPGGALAVPDGDAIIPGINALMAEADTVVLTQDWHPAGHSSFASSGTALTLVGLATDFCVNFSAADAAKLGYAVTVRTDLCRAIDLDGSLVAAQSGMTAAGVTLA